MDLFNIAQNKAKEENLLNEKMPFVDNTCNYITVALIIVNYFHKNPFDMLVAGLLYRGVFNSK